MHLKGNPSRCGGLSRGRRGSASWSGKWLRRLKPAEFDGANDLPDVGAGCGRCSAAGRPVAKDDAGIRGHAEASAISLSAALTWGRLAGE